MISTCSQTYSPCVVASIIFSAEVDFVRDSILFFPVSSLCFPGFVIKHLVKHEIQIQIGLKETGNRGHNRERSVQSLIF